MIELKSAFDGDVSVSLTWVLAPSLESGKYTQKLEIFAGPQASGPPLFEIPNIPANERSRTIPLPAGLVLRNPLLAQFTLERPNALPMQASTPVERPRHPMPLEALKTVYAENQNELRRTRTVFESMLVTETVGFAVLANNIGSISRTISSFWERLVVSTGVLFLTILLGYLVSALSRRYDRISRLLRNIHCAMGISDAPWDGSIFAERDGIKSSHWTWAVLLITYTGLLGAGAIWGVMCTGSPPSPDRLIAASAAIAVLAMVLLFLTPLRESVGTRKPPRWPRVVLGVGVAVGAATIIFFRFAAAPPGAAATHVSALSPPRRSVAELNLGGTRYGVMATGLGVSQVGEQSKVSLVFQPPGSTKWFTRPCSLKLSADREVVFPIDGVPVGSANDVQAMLVVTNDPLLPEYEHEELLPVERLSSGRFLLALSSPPQAGMPGQNP